MLEPVKPYLLVANPTAQSGKNQERIDAAVALFRAHGQAVEVFSTLPDGATVAALVGRLASAPDAFAAVVAMGGDGTFREVGAALLELEEGTRPPLGMLPTGTANDQGKSFGLSAAPDALERNIGVVLAGRETLLDAGIVRSNDRRDAFFDSVGWGLTARVLHVRNKDREIVDGLGPLGELYRDHLVYAGAFVKTFLDSYIETDKFDALVHIDGREVRIEGLTDLVLKATRVFAGSWVLDRGGAHDDGLFELVPFVGKRDWLSKAIVAIDGNPVREEDLNELGVEHSKNMQGASFRVVLEPLGVIPVHAQMDGEEYPGSTQFQIDVLPRALRLIVP